MILNLEIFKSQPDSAHLPSVFECYMDRSPYPRKELSVFMSQATAERFPPCLVRWCLGPREHVTDHLLPGILLRHYS